MPISSPQALSAAFAAAVNAGDVPAALDLWVEDGAIMQPDGNVLRGRAAIGRRNVEQSNAPRVAS